MVRQGETMRVVSVRSRMHKADCLLDGKEEKTILGEHTMWTITPGRPHGSDPRRTSMLASNVRRWISKLISSATGIKHECCQRIGLAPTRLHFPTDKARHQLIRQLLQIRPMQRRWSPQELRLLEQASYRLVGSSDTRRKAEPTSWIIILGLLLGLTRGDSST